MTLHRKPRLFVLNYITCIQAPYTRGSFPACDYGDEHLPTEALASRTAHDLISHDQALGACTWSSPVKVEAWGAMAAALNSAGLESDSSDPSCCNLLAPICSDIPDASSSGPKKLLESKASLAFGACFHHSFKQRSLDLQVWITPTQSCESCTRALSPACEARSNSPAFDASGSRHHEDRHLACSN